MSYDVGEVTERLENEQSSQLQSQQSSFSNLYSTLPTSQLILKSFRRFTYVTVHSPTLLSLLLRHKLFTYFTWRAVHGQTFPMSLKEAMLRFMEHEVKKIPVSTFCRNWFHLQCRFVLVQIIIRSFCPRTGLSLQMLAPRMEFCSKAGLPPQTQEPRLQFYQE